MTAGQAETRRRNQVEELCAAAVRALSGDPALHFRARRLHRGREPLPLHAPHLRQSADDDLRSARGIADGMALRLTASDAALHRGLSPRDPAERGIFELLEQFRVESLPPADLPGMRRNLRLRHVRWSLEFHRSGLTETARGLLLYTVAQICRSRITGEPVVEETEDLIEATRFALAPSLGHDLAGLRRHRTDQKAFAEHALAIARTTSGLLAGTAREAEDEGDPTDPRFSLAIHFDTSHGEQIPSATAGTSRTLGESGAAYRVFTTAYDRERRASDLVRPAMLAELRERLDRRVGRQGVGPGRLARDLKAVLAEPARDGWDGAQEEGLLDGRTLAQLISSPTERRIFRTERIEPVADTLVTFLIDCSGSMTAHAEPVAALVDLFARSIELAGATCEVLGFTTGGWNGGRPRRDWIRAGRPRHPGRLNERLHLVFKAAGTPWRRARPDLAALLKADLFREGIDGEAVAWACSRMRARTEARRILLVLSDGSPMDSATSLANDPHYLDEHLRETVLREESTVEIRGVGVGLDLSPFYRRSRVLDTSVTSGYAPFRDVLELLAPEVNAAGDSAAVATLFAAVPAELGALALVAAVLVALAAAELGALLLAAAVLVALAAAVFIPCLAAGRVVTETATLLLLFVLLPATGLTEVVLRLVGGRVDLVRVLTETGFREIGGLVDVLPADLVLHTFEVDTHENSSHLRISGVHRTPARTSIKVHSRRGATRGRRVGESRGDTA